MGFVDRGGGRESKGGSLRRSKKNPGAAAARVANHHKHAVQTSPVSLPAPTLPHGASLAVDCAVALLSRKLDPTRESLASAAKEYGCGAMVTWCSEVDKQKTLVEACTPLTSFSSSSASLKDKAAVYCVVGVHPDNVDKTNKKAHEGWLNEVSELAKAPQCVGVLVGLNLQRDVNTHFAQESLLTELVQMARDKLQLPVIVYTPRGDCASLERALEIIMPLMATNSGLEERDNGQEEQPVGSFSSRVIVAELLATKSPKLIQQVAESGVMAMLSASWLAADLEIAPGTKVSQLVSTDQDLKAVLQQNSEEAIAAIKSFPKKQILLSSNSPWSTPQTLEEEHLRMLPNEPCNLVPGVAKLLASALDCCSSAGELIALSTENAISAFGFGAAAPVLKTAANNTTSSTTAGGGEPDQEGSESGDNGEEEEGTANNVGDENDDDADDDGCSPQEGAKPSVKFTCVKCRAPLFVETNLVTPSEATLKALSGNKGGGGKKGGGFTNVSSPSGFFLRASFRCSGLKVTEEGTIECSNCGVKIGSAAPGEPLRVIGSRVDRLEELSEEELLLRAAREREEVEKLNAEKEENWDADDGKKKKKGPKQNVKASNRSNMVNYRNKNWTPGRNTGDISLAAELEALKDDQDDSDDGRKPSKKKGKRRNKGDDW